METNIKEPLSVSVAEFRSRLAEYLDRCRQLRRRVVITSHGKPKAVLLSYPDYQGLLRSRAKGKEEPLDLKAWEKGAAKRESVVDSISSLFDPSRLSRKGQKGYKRHAVKQFEKAQKRTRKSSRRKKA